MRIPKETIDAKLAIVPNRVREAVHSSSLADAIDRIGATHGFTTEQTALLLEESLYFILQIGGPDSFETNLVRYLGVSADLAARVAAEVIQELSQLGSAAVNEQGLLYTHTTPDIELTSKLLKYGPCTYPISVISEVSLLKMPFEFGTLVINGMVILFLGLPLVLSFSGWSIVGLIVLSVCGFNVKDIFKKHYALTIELRGSSDISIYTTDEGFAFGFHKALQKALSS